MAACIFLFCILYSVVVNVQHMVKAMEDTVGVTVFFDEGLSEEEIQAIGDVISARSEVADMRFVSAEEAWESYKEDYFAGMPELAEGFDAVVVAAGARAARGLAARNVEAPGVAFAVDYLTAATRAVLEGAPESAAMSAAGLDVVVIGGGDTGNDCVGTAVRQGARSVRQLEFMPRPADKRLPGNPWPEWPNTGKCDYGQEEAIALMGGEMRAWAVDTLEVLVDEEGAARGVRVADLDWSQGKPERIAGSERDLPAQLVLIACGFTGPERGVMDALGVALAEQGRPLPVMAQPGGHLCARTEGAPAVPVYAAGDARNGSSLVVSAMADALACAKEVAAALGL